MKRLLIIMSLCTGVMAAGAGSLQAQTRADSAAVLLHTAEQLRQRGEGAAARALLDYIERHFAGTPAASDVQRMRAVVRRTPDMERSGRTELMAFGATYGAWLGIALPWMAGAQDPAPYGLGLLAGAPVGFLAARAYADAFQPTEGQTRAITFGGTWGTYQGYGWAQALDIGQRRVISGGCPPNPEWPCYEYEYEETDEKVQVAMSVLGGLAGIATGAVLAQKPITAGTAAVVTSSGSWGSWFGFGLSFIAGMEDDALLGSTLVAGNVALIGAGMLAPQWQVSEPRMRLINIGGIIGGLGGLGLVLITQPDNAKVGIALPLLGSAAGLALAANTTQDSTPAVEEDGGRGALINRSGGRWALHMPDAVMTLQRADGRVKPAAYVPLLRARF
jgi:hypothetical protein